MNMDCENNCYFWGEKTDFTNFTGEKATGRAKGSVWMQYKEAEY